MKCVLNILLLILAASSCIRPSGTDKTSSLNTEPCLAPVALDDNASRIATVPMDCQLDSSGKKTVCWPYSYQGKLERRRYYKEGLLNGEYYSNQLFYDKTGTLQGPYMLRSTVDANVYVLGEFRDGDFSGTWSRFAKDGRIIESISNIEPNDSFVVLGRRPAYTGTMTEFDADGDTLSCQRYFFSSYPFTKQPVFSTIPPSDTTKISSRDE